MEKTIVIDGKEIRFKSTGATALRYKSQFGQDLFKDLFKMAGLEKVVNKNASELDPKDLEALDFNVFYNLIWILAKTADDSIPEPIAWLDTFDEFPMMEVIPELHELIFASMKSSKKKSMNKKAKK
jgi:hypothetical protein